MSDYAKAVDFAIKDGLPSGNSAKIVRGTEIDNEFNAIEIHMATKANSISPTLSGTVTLSGTLTGGTIDGGIYTGA